MTIGSGILNKENSIRIMLIGALKIEKYNRTELNKIGKEKCLEMIGASVV